MADEKTVQEKIVDELSLKLLDAKAGKIEALWSLDIQRNSSGEVVPTMTIVVEASTTEAQRDRVQQHLQGILDVLREIYTK